jgi:hypothetical protein
MEKFLNFLSQNLIGVSIGIIGIVLGIIGIALTIKSRVSASLSYQTRSLEIIEKSKQILPKEITITFGDKIVQRLTKTEVILWNSGRTTLHGIDIVAEDPLRLEFSKDAQILQTRIIKSNRDTNKFTSIIRVNSPNIVDFSFDYLEPGDGAVVEILHTDKELYPKIQGTIRGLRKGAKYSGYIPSYSGSRTISKYKLLRRFYTVIFFFLSIDIFIMGLIMLIISKAKKPMSIEFSPFGSWFLIIISTLSIVLILLDLWLYRRRFPKSLTMRNI